MAGAALVAAGDARAEDYPARPIRLVVGFVPGGGLDFAARVLAEALTSRLGQPVVVENKPGAATMIGLDYVAKSPPDGYTLAYGAIDGLPIMAAEKPKMPYNFADDFTYISRVAQLDLILTVSTKLPVKTLAELVAYARANPGKIRYGIVGVGTTTQLAVLLLGLLAGVSMTAVPYKGGAAVLTDVLAGVVDMGFLTVTNIADYTHSDKVRLLAVTGPTREPSLPDVPTMAEAGYPGATMVSWQGVLGPAKLPPAISDRLSAAITDALKDTTVQQRLLRLALNPVPLAGDAFRNVALSDYQQWKKVVDTTHIVID